MKGKVMKKNLKYGFSLGEMCITVGIVAFLAMVLLPVLKSILPNQEMMMFKKAYYITERAVSEMINDEELYPESNNPSASPYFGNTESVTVKGETYQGDTKFCEIFASRVNRASGIDCSEHDFTDGSNPSDFSFITTDGVVWILPITNFADNTTPYDIYMDVNGDKKPNCFYDKDSCEKPDRFNVKVYQDGRISVEGTMEKEYLYRSNITKDAKSETEDAKEDEED